MKCCLEQQKLQTAAPAREAGPGISSARRVLALKRCRGSPELLRQAGKKKGGEGELKSLKSLTLQEPWSYRIVSEKQALALSVQPHFLTRQRLEPFDCLLGFLTWWCCKGRSEKRVRHPQKPLKRALLPPKPVWIWGAGWNSLSSQHASGRQKLERCRENTLTWLSKDRTCEKEWRICPPFGIANAGLKQKI